MPFTASPPQLTSTSSLASASAGVSLAAIGARPMRGRHAHEHAARIDLAFRALYELLDIVQAIANVRHGPILLGARVAPSTTVPR